MNDRSQADALSLAKYGVGQPVLRTEDPVLLRGEGRYTDDLNEPGQAYAYIVRSPHAHGILRTVNTAAAKAMPGVLAVYTAEDLAAYGSHKCIVPLVNRDGTPMKKPERRSLTSGKVRFVGDPVACVVAETYRAGEGRGRGDRARHRAAARGVARERGGARGRAAALRRRAGQRGVRFPLRRRRRRSPRPSPARRT